MSFWGGVKHKTIVDVFGDLGLIAAVPLAIPTAPQASTAANEVAPVDLDPVIHDQVGLPPLAFDDTVAKLPALAPRAWVPAKQLGASLTDGVSYLALAEIDVVEALDLVERINERLRR